MSNNTNLKKENVLQVLQIVKNGAGMTKPEIAMQSGLTGVTVHNVITNLEQQGIVVCEGVSASNGGRKAVKYGINKQFKYLIGVYLRTNKITVGIFDYNIELLHKISERSPLGERSVEETIRDITKMIHNSMQELRISEERVAGIGINVPGPVDYERGRVISLRGYPNWKNVTLKESMEHMTGIPTYVDKDVNSGMLLLKWSKNPRNTQNMLYLSIEDGIGASVMIGGRVYRGNHGVAGEIGHITVQQNGPKCACGNVGCLEMFSSDFAIIERTRKELSLDPRQDLSIDDVIELSNAGNEIVRKIFVDATAYLATTIRNTFMLYDPDEIFINSKWLYLNEQLFFGLIDSLYDNNTLIDRGDIRITLINMKDFGLKSAGAIVADHEMESVDSSVFQTK